MAKKLSRFRSHDLKWVNLHVSSDLDLNGPLFKFYQVQFVLDIAATNPMPYQRVD